MLGVVVALLHDSGYLKRASEGHVENGAVFTKIHVSRSADFLVALPAAARLRRRSGARLEAGALHRLRDGHRRHHASHDPKDRLLGCLVGTADLIGQMSDRMYLEKCREFLYQEFVLGQHRARDARRRARDRALRLARGPDAQDARLLRVRGAPRASRRSWAAADRYAEAHFDGPSLYQAEIDRNMQFLRKRSSRRISSACAASATRCPGRKRRSPSACTSLKRTPRQRASAGRRPRFPPCRGLARWLLCLRQGRHVHRASPANDCTR